MNCFETIYGAVYTFAEFKNPANVGKNWSDLWRRARMAWTQDKAAFVTCLTLEQLRTLLPVPTMVAKLEAALAVLETFEAGALQFFVFRPNFHPVNNPNAPASIFLAFLDMREPDEYGPSGRMKPVVYEQFSTLLEDPDGAFARVAIEVIRGGGYVPNVPQSLPPWVQRANDANRAPLDEQALLDRNLLRLADGK